MSQTVVELLRAAIGDAVALVAAKRGVELSSKDQAAIAAIKLDSVPENFASQADIATNVAMLMSKTFSVNPMLLAEEIGEALVGPLAAGGGDDPQSSADKPFRGLVESFVVAKPAFINLKLSKECYRDGLKVLLTNDVASLLPKVGNGEKMNVEFVSANPTGPLHIGHVRGAIYGQTLANLLERVGFEVVREYYINDGGSQITTLLKSALLRYKQAVEGLDDIEIPESCYPGEYLVPVGKKIAQEFGKSLMEVDENEAREKIRTLVVDEMMKLIKASLAKLGVRHDVFVSEKAMIDDGHVGKAIDLLRQKGLCYRGVLDKPKGIDSTDWVPEEQELFKSSSFGDSSDRAIARADGSLSYFAPDIGYHYYKYKRGFEKMVLVLGADHKGYVSRISAAVSAISDGNAQIAVRLCEMVNFIEDGQKVKSSKRSGKFLTSDDILEELDLDVLKFIILSRKNDTVLDFDLQLAKSQSKENPVFYTQYAYSRCSSLLRSYKEAFGADFDPAGLRFEADWSIFDNKLVRDMVVLCNMYPSVVLQAATTYDLHILATYALNLAGQLHALWGGDESTRVRFLNKEQKDETDRNMAIVFMIRSVLKSCLGVLGVSAPESM